MAEQIAQIAASLDWFDRQMLPMLASLSMTHGAFLFLEIIISHLPKGHGSYPNSAISFSANSIPIFSCASTVEAPV